MRTPAAPAPAAIGSSTSAGAYREEIARIELLASSCSACWARIAINATPHLQSRHTHSSSYRTADRFDWGQRSCSFCSSRHGKDQRGRSDPSLRRSQSMTSYSYLARPEFFGYAYAACTEKEQWLVARPPPAPRRAVPGHAGQHRRVTSLPTLPSLQLQGGGVRKPFPRRQCSCCTAASRQIYRPLSSNGRFYAEGYGRTAGPRALISPNRRSRTLERRRRESMAHQSGAPRPRPAAAGVDWRWP